MCIVSDTALKMNVSTLMVFEMWACFQDNVSQKELDHHYDRWYYEGKLNSKIESFCIDIMTDRIPLIALPLKAKKK